MFRKESSFYSRDDIHKVFQALSLLRKTNNWVIDSQFRYIEQTEIGISRIRRNVGLSGYRLQILKDPGKQIR